jgi:hypothetical protein
MSVGVMKDQKLKLWKLLSSHTLGCPWNWNTYSSTDTRDKKCLSETIRLDLISVMRPDLLEPTHGFKV